MSAGFHGMEDLDEMPPEQFEFWVQYELGRQQEEADLAGILRGLGGA